MKIRGVLLLMLICVPLAFALIPPSSAEFNHLQIADAQREVYLQEYGIVTITDTLSITNLGSTPAFHVWAAYPLSETKHLQFFRAETEFDAPLKFQQTPLIGLNNTGWKIYLPEPLMPNQTTIIKTIFVFDGISTQDRVEARLTFSKVPTSPYIISSYETYFEHHDGVSDPGIGQWSGGNVSAYSYLPITAIMNIEGTNGKPLMSYLELHRIFTVDAWGYLFVREIHKLRVNSPNLKEWNWRKKFETTVPPGSEFLRAYDRLSNLSVRIVTPTNLTHSGSLIVEFEYNLLENDVYEFALEYRIPLDINQLILQNGQYLTINPYYDHPWVIRHQITEFVLPLGSSLFEAPLGSETTMLPTNQFLVRFNDYNVTSLFQRELTLHYVYPIQSGLERPLFIALIFGFVCLAYIVARRVPIFREEEDIIAEVPDIDQVLLGEFCALYGEKVALLLQTERLQHSMLSGKIAKPRYRKEKKIFERKLRSLDKELQGRAQPLLEAGGKYEASCRQLEILEAERVSAIEAIRALEQRYRQKRITPTVYQKLRKDLEKRRDRSVTRMDRILLDLRGELEE